MTLIKIGYPVKRPYFFKVGDESVYSNKNEKKIKKLKKTFDERGMIW